VQIFISEYLSSGACMEESYPVSMLQEGICMLAAVMEDISAIDGCECVTTVDFHLMEQLNVAQLNVTGSVIPVQTAQVAEKLFAELSAASAAVCLIAPETGNILHTRCDQVTRLNSRFLGCSIAAIALCTNKQRLASYLLTRGIPTIPVFELFNSDCPTAFPCLLKPRDGAGGQMTFRIENSADWQAALQQFRQCTQSLTPICQSYIAGQSVSVAALVAQKENTIEIFPVASQHFSDDK